MNIVHNFFDLRSFIHSTDSQSTYFTKFRAAQIESCNFHKIKKRFRPLIQQKLPSLVKSIVHTRFLPYEWISKKGNTKIERILIYIQNVSYTSSFKKSSLHRSLRLKATLHKTIALRIYGSRKINWRNYFHVFQNIYDKTELLWYSHPLRWEENLKILSHIVDFLNTRCLNLHLKNIWSLRTNNYGNIKGSKGDTSKTDALTRINIIWKRVCFL